MKLLELWVETDTLRACLLAFMTDTCQDQSYVCSKPSEFSAVGRKEQGRVRAYVS